MLKSYVPALVFLILGIGIGTAFTLANNFLGPRRPNKTKSEPYECGLPSEVQKSFRFGVSFYLIAMLFILFDIEVVFLYPVAMQLDGDRVEEDHLDVEQDEEHRDQVEADPEAEALPDVRGKPALVGI